MPRQIGENDPEKASKGEGVGSLTGASVKRSSRRTAAETSKWNACRTRPFRRFERF